MADLRARIASTLDPNAEIRGAAAVGGRAGDGGAAAYRTELVAAVGDERAVVGGADGDRRG